MRASDFNKESAKISGKMTQKGDEERKFVTLNHSENTPKSIDKTKNSPKSNLKSLEIQKALKKRNLYNKPAL